MTETSGTDPITDAPTALFHAALIVMSVAAFLVSLLTAYFSFFRRGRVVFPPPNKIRLDSIPGIPGMKKFHLGACQKIFFRACFSATSIRGLYIENLNVELEKEGENPFRIQSTTWQSGDDCKPAAPFFANKDGTLGDFHFIFDTPHNQYDEGVYKICLKAKIYQNSKVQTLWEDRFEINEAKKSVIFDRNIDTGKYIINFEDQHQGTPPESIPELMHLMQSYQSQGTPPASIPELMQRMQSYQSQGTPPASIPEPNPPASIPELMQRLFDPELMHLRKLHK